MTYEDKSIIRLIRNENRKEKWQKILQMQWSVISVKRLIRKITKTGLILRMLLVE